MQTVDVHRGRKPTLAKRSASVDIALDSIMTEEDEVCPRMIGALLRTRLRSAVWPGRDDRFRVNCATKPLAP